MFLMDSLSLATMDMKAFIDSGELEQYCFGSADAVRAKEIEALRLAHSEIDQELNAIEAALARMAINLAITPDPHLKSRILSAVFSEDRLDLNNLPPTSQYADHESWLKAVEPLLPAEFSEDFFAQVLQQNDKLAQTLVVTKLDVPAEIHETVRESFFILKGTCVCRVGDEVFTLNAGDYLDIPLHTSHDIKIRSPYVVAILQHQF